MFITTNNMCKEATVEKRLRGKRLRTLHVKKLRVIDYSQGQLPDKLKIQEKIVSYTTNSISKV